MKKKSHIDQAKQDAPANPVCATEFHFQARRSVNAIMSIWQKQADAQNTKLVVHIANDIPETLPIDAHKIQYCLNNIVSNAIKHAQGGTVKIIVTKIISKQGKPYLVLSVQDNGVGMEQSVLDAVFNNTASQDQPHKKAYGYVDTSLPITQGLMGQIGGQILVNSQVNNGATFSLLLPYTPVIEPLHGPAHAYSVSDFRKFSAYKILVVDDYNLNQLTVKIMLDDHIAKIYTAANGYDALEILHTCPVDLVLMDIHMPVLDGIEATLKIRESGQNWAGVRIVAMTADPHYQHMRLCQKIGMDDTLAKPFRKADLLRVFENAALPYKSVAV